MTDIFISYAREDEMRVRELVQALEEDGWSIFWDRRIPAGKTWESYIGQALSNARCVIVAWSRHSVTSDWVKDEANDAKGRGVLVPVLLDSVQPPLGFRGIQAADLTEWKPGYSSPHLDQLIQDITGVLGAKPLHGPNSMQPRPRKRGTKGPSSFLIGAAIALALAIVAGSVLWFARDSPRVPKKRPTEPQPNHVEEAKQLSRVWAEAVVQRDIDRLVQISSPPFLFLNTILTDSNQIRKKYQNWRPTNIKGIFEIRRIRTVSEYMNEPAQPGRDHNVHNMQLNGDDIVVLACTMEHCNDGVLLFFRKQNSGLIMAGVW